MKPETPLPWEHFSDINQQNAWDKIYAVHACNAYPKLVNFLKFCRPGNQTDAFVREQLLNELGEEGVRCVNAYPKLVYELRMLAEFCRMIGHEGEQREAKELLEELGENVDSKDTPA